MKKLYLNLKTFLEAFKTAYKAATTEPLSQVTPENKTLKTENTELKMDNTFHIYKKGSNLKLSPNFNSDEFDCKCGNLCDKTYIAKEVIEVIQRLREALGEPITITSAYRCKEHNQSVGGAKNSTHPLGLAVDLKCSDLGRLATLIEIHYPQYSIGRYNTFVHLDIRKDGRRWDYRK